MELIVSPYVGVGSFRFGMGRGTCRALMDKQHTAFGPGHHSRAITDRYVLDGINLEYDEEDRLVFIEMMYPARPTLRGVGLLGDFQSTVSSLNSLGILGELTDVGYECLSEGIALYSPSGIVETAAAFAAGYYES